MVGSAQQALAERALSLYRGLGHREGEAMALSAISWGLRQLQQLDQAIKVMRQSVETGAAR
jgi:hypothetical protein